MARVLIGNIKGPQGNAATVGVGTVTTGAPGTAASVTNSGTSTAATLDFQIPKGDKGDPGDPGVNDYASSSAAGLVRVGDDVAVDSSSGILSLNSTNITEASSVSNINSGDSYRTILGKLKKFISTLLPSNFLINTVNSNAADKGLTANMGNKLAGDIATVQTSNTATRNFAVGEYIVYNGIMYKVTTAIASGGTLTPGTNLTATNAGAQLKSLNDSLTPRTVGTTSTHTNYIQCFKVGRLRVLYGNVVLTSDVSPWSSIVFELTNAADRPLYTNITLPIVNTDDTKCYLEIIYNSGRAQASKAFASGTQLKFAGCWISQE